MKFTYFSLTIISLIALINAEDVRLENLEPNEAQQIIESKDQSLKYAPKVDSNVPAVRFLGNEPHNVLEDIYLANQYHGQDGLGGYLYGYSVPDIAKTEKKVAGGDLKGAYNYVNGDGQEIKVEYWDDGTGFHQVDNVPKILPTQIPDTPEVQAAKDEHARIWQEQAERNSKPIPSPYENNAYKPEIAAQIGAQSQQHQYQQPQPGQYQQTQGQSQQPQGQYQHSQGLHQQTQGQYQQPQGQYQQPQGQSQQPQGQYQQSQGLHQQTQGQYQQPQGQYQQPQGQFQQSQQGHNQQTQGQQQQPQGQFQQHQQTQGQFQQHQQPQGQFQQAQQPQGQFQQPQPAQQPQGQHQQSQSGQYQGQLQGLGQTNKPGVNVGQPHGNINQVDYSGQYSNNAASYASKQHDENNGEDDNNNEENGPPRGFFYNFDYPVGIIVNKDGNQIQKRESLTDIYAKNLDYLGKQLTGEAKPPQTGYSSYSVTE